MSFFLGSQSLQTPTLLWCLFSWCFDCKTTTLSWCFLSWCFDCKTTLSWCFLSWCFDCKWLTVESFKGQNPVTQNDFWSPILKEQALSPTLLPLSPLLLTSVDDATPLQCLVSWHRYLCLSPSAVCCGLPGENARSHGPTLGYRDVHLSNEDDTDPASRWHCCPSPCATVRNPSNGLLSHHRFLDRLLWWARSTLLCGRNYSAPLTILALLPGVSLLTPCLPIFLPSSTVSTPFPLLSLKRSVLVHIAQLLRPFPRTIPMKKPHTLAILLFSPP